MHLYGGNILALQQPALTTVAHRKTPWTILVALSYNMSHYSSSSYREFPVTGGTNGSHADGKLFIDDGESYVESGNYYLVEFTARDQHLKATTTHSPSGSLPSVSLSVERIIILGVPTSPSALFVGGSLHSNWTHDGIQLTIFTPGVGSLVSWEISWDFTPSPTPSNNKSASQMVVLFVAVILSLLVVIVAGVACRKRIAQCWSDCKKTSPPWESEGAFNRLDDIKFEDSSEEMDL